MPFLDLSLEKISQCPTLKDLAPPSQQEVLMAGLDTLRKGHLKGHKIARTEDGAFQLEFYFHDEVVFPEVVVTLHEEEPQGMLFSKSLNNPSVGDNEVGKHQWATVVLLWWAYAQDASLLRRLDTRIAYFCRDFQEVLFENKNPKADEVLGAELPPDLKLDSLSLVLDEIPLKGSAGLGDVLPSWDGHYQLTEVPFVDDPRNTLLWDLPQVFRKPLNIDGVFYWSDLKKQNQLAAVIRYNFSNGIQLSSREVLRHSYRSIVPRDLLPSAVRRNSIQPGWPLLPRHEADFVSRDLSDIEEVLQELLARVAYKVQRGEVRLFLQSEAATDKGLELRNFSFEGRDDFFWSVHFEGESSVLTKTTLSTHNPNSRFHFFQSFALDLESQSVVVFPWLREIEAFKDFFNRTLSVKVSDFLAPFTVEGITETSAYLKFIRGRALQVRIRGGSHHIPARYSTLEMHFQNTGGFVLEHVFEFEEKIHRHRGWSAPAVHILRALSLGLSVMTSTDLKSLISRGGKKRDWDLKLVKHMGVLQYLTLEALSLHFEGHLTDGSTCSPQNLVAALHTNIQSLLLTGEGTVLDRGLPLSELCSRPVLSCLESFVAQVFKSLSETYSVYAPEGELIYSGLVERDFRVVFEILKQWASATQGGIFKKARTSLLGKIWDGDPEVDLLLSEGEFFFPTAGRDPMLVSQALVLLQPLKDHRVRLLLNGQALVELTDNEFQVDFQIVSNLEDKMLNWFELNPRFFLQGQEVDPDSIKNLGGGGVLEYNGQFYIIPKTQVPSMRRLESFWLKLQQGKKETTKKKNWNDKVYQIPKSQTLELLALRASGYAIRGDEEWQKLCHFYDSLGGAKSLMKVPSSVRGDLKHYQHEGMQWLYDLYKLKMGALLADDMGLGKTLQALSFLEFLRTQGELDQVLVVVPSSLVYNWESEIGKFTPQLPLQIFTSKEMSRVAQRLESKEPLVVVTTYGLLMENDEFMSQYKWNVLIFDEAQNLKNITTKRTSSARMLSARFKICMTGTPMENHYGEFYSLMDLIVPGCLGKYEDFRRHFVNTEVVLVEDVEDLKLRTKPLLLRRTKKEILDQLPEKQETRVSIAFEENQKKIYRDIALAYNQKIQETMKDATEAQVQLQMLTALLRLRQACSDPGALPQVKYEQVPPKLEALMDSLKEIIESGESALVFTQFLQTLEHTEKLLKDAGVPVFVLHGGVPTKQRQKVLRDFNECEQGAVLVMTLKTGGVGLNLTKASYVFHLEPWWNPSVENQATDRAHRLGQKKAVQVFRYIMHESLEEKMEELKSRKSKKFQSLFSEAESIKDVGTGSGALSKEDFDFLLGLK